VCPIVKVALWVVYGVPYSEGCSMGGLWCALIVKVTLWVIHSSVTSELGL